MPLVIALFVVLLLAGLAGSFIANARFIRRDINDRFDKIRVRLEEDATAIVQNVIGTSTNERKTKPPEPK